MSITLTLEDDLADRMRRYEGQLTEIVELGLREWCARGEPGYSGLRDILETLASLPTPEQILALRPGARLQERIAELLEKNRAGGLSVDEQREWDQVAFLEHLVRLAKANAALKLQDRPRP